MRHNGLSLVTNLIGNHSWHFVAQVHAGQQTLCADFGAGVAQQDSAELPCNRDTLRRMKHFGVDESCDSWCCWLGIKQQNTDQRGRAFENQSTDLSSRIGRESSIAPVRVNANRLAQDNLVLTEGLRRSVGTHGRDNFNENREKLDPIVDSGSLTHKDRSNTASYLFKLLESCSAECLQHDRGCLLGG